ncbi:hypothetical protein, partial [Nonomuraea sp. NPDC049784]|uniref:hypothetical protein n=1 Tax=Nonomuraea sp. NPDC049784 TaxID=3154361 RepID=UPI0033EE0341
MPKRGRPGPGQLDLFAVLEATAPTSPALPDPTSETVVEPPAPALTALATAQAKVLRPARTTRASVSPARIAEDVEAAWHAHHGGSDIVIPLSVVAALALVSQHDPRGPDMAAEFLTLEPDDLLQVLRDIWSIAWIIHPYLIGTIALPLHSWLHDDQRPRPQLARAVHAVAHAAINAGQFALTGHPDPALRRDADLLGAMLTQMRTNSASRPLGAFYSSASHADLMAQMMLGDSA